MEEPDAPKVIHMKKIILLLFLLLTVLPSAWSKDWKPDWRDKWDTVDPTELSPTDTFQAEQWLRTARALWEVGDYPTLRLYCNRIVEYYPETYYAMVAEKLLIKSRKPPNNRSREYIRNNPGLFPIQ